MHAPRLTLPRDVLAATLPRLLADAQAAFGLAGKVARVDRNEYLLGRLKVSPEPPPGWRRPAEHQVPFVLRTGAQWRAPLAWEAWLREQRIDAASTLGLVAVTPAGEAIGWVHGETWQPIGGFNWPGTGMERLSVRVSGKDEGDEPTSARDSRLAGALSPPVLSRLRGLEFAVVGVSRAGSLVAHSLARWGVRRLALIDPDLVEPHNADAGEFDPELDEGRPKVAAAAKSLLRLPPAGRQVHQIHQPLLAPLAFSAARMADVIITCVDDDGARLTASVLAASHLRVHLDIGVQVSVDSAGRRSAGADIRLVLPEAAPWCLACLGGFAQADSLRRLAGFDKTPAPEWNRLRAGSLRTVNQIAVHLGLRLIERLVSGEITRSTWLRYEDNPVPTLREIVLRRPWNCDLCGRFLGIGDAVYQDRDLRMRQLVRSIAGLRETGSLPAR